MKRWIDFIGGKMWLDPEASEFEALMAAGRWEHRKVALLQKYLKPGMTFVDAGAHWGYFSLIAAKMGAEVVAFEPNNDNLTELRNNFHHNHYSGALVGFALWCHEGTLTFYTGFNEATHSAVKNHERGETEVYARTLDYCWPTYAPDIMKIDVEGADIQVLEGASVILGNTQDLVILMDLHPELGVHNEDVGQLLRAHGFRLYDIRSDNAPIETIPPTMVELLALKGYEG